MTICRLVLWRSLKVWKNPSWVASRPRMNWMSSISSTSTPWVLLPELPRPAGLNGGHKVVGELLGTDVEVTHTLGGAGVAYGVEQVRLAKAHPGVEEEGVVRLTRPGGHGQRGGVGQLVGGPDHKGA